MRCEIFNSPTNYTFQSVFCRFCFTEQLQRCIFKTDTSDVNSALCLALALGMTRQLANDKKGIFEIASKITYSDN